MNKTSQVGQPFHPPESDRNAEMRSGLVKSKEYSKSEAARIARISTGMDSYPDDNPAMHKHEITVHGPNHER